MRETESAGEGWGRPMLKAGCTEVGGLLVLASAAGRPRGRACGMQILTS